MIPKIMHSITRKIVLAMVLTLVIIDAGWRWLWGKKYDLKGRV